ncbi:MAG: hypothetical protein ACRDPH_08755 [Marmoricola sp.]
MVDAKAEAEQDRPFPDRKKEHAMAIAAVRTKVAALVKVICGVLAVLLAIGALLVVLEKYISSGNNLVQLIWDIDKAIDGPFARDGSGVFAFHGHNAVKFDAVVNWGIAAVIYLLIGVALNKLLMPRRSVGSATRR